MSSKDIKPGDQTSEKKTKDSSSVWGIVALVLGALITVGSAMLPNVESTSIVGIIAGAVVAVAGIAQKLLVDLGYIKSRTEVKAAAELKNTGG